MPITITCPECGQKSLEVIKDKISIYYYCNQCSRFNPTKPKGAKK